jgi:hypothetical protein
MEMDVWSVVLMREIKFRHWDEEEKYMTSWEEIRILPGEDLLFEVFKEPRGILMQYTGLKDKNGKEIYEGDIVQRYWYANNDLKKKPLTYPYHLVKWNDLKLEFNISDSRGSGNYYKIVGNIYENPELQKEINKSRHTNGN